MVDSVWIVDDSTSSFGLVPGFTNRNSVLFRMRWTSPNPQEVIVGHNITREALKKAYPSKKWAEKVNEMTDAQVVAVYFRLHREGKVK